jgi:hypothetical protein
MHNTISSPFAAVNGERAQQERKKNRRHLGSLADKKMITWSNNKRKNKIREIQSFALTRRYFTMTSAIKITNYLERASHHTFFRSCKRNKNGR